METKEERTKRIKREYYQRSKDKFKEYYEFNKEVISNKHKERYQDVKKDKEKYEERLRKSRESRRKYREQNREKLKESDRRRYEKNKLKEKLPRPEYFSPITRMELIQWTVDFVDRIEKRKGLISFEELFGELLDIAFYIPTTEKERDQDVGEQLMVIWGDVKHFANAFRKELTGFDWDNIYDLKLNGMCKYCEKSSIVNSHNTCSKCKGIMLYIDKLG